MKVYRRDDGRRGRGWQAVCVSCQTLGHNGAHFQVAIGKVMNYTLKHELDTMLFPSGWGTDGLRGGCSAGCAIACIVSVQVSDGEPEGSNDARCTSGGGKLRVKQRQELKNCNNSSNGRMYSGC